MMDKAELHYLNAELAKAKRDAVKPVNLASNQPGTVAPTSYDRTLDALLAGKSLSEMTKDEKHTLYPDRY